MTPFERSVAFWLHAYPRRWREHPPFWRWLGHHVVQRRLPARFDGWVRDERVGLLTGLRSAALPFLGLLVVGAGVEGGLRHLGWVTWTFTTTPLIWWIWLVIALVQAAARTVGREEWMGASFATAADAPGHFGPYVPLHAAGTVESAGRGGTDARST